MVVCEYARRDYKGQGGIYKSRGTYEISDTFSSTAGRSATITCSPVWKTDDKNTWGSKIHPEPSEINAEFSTARLAMEKAEDKVNQSTNQLGWRHVQALLLFFVMATTSALRVCMSVAAIAMRNTTANPEFPHYPWDQPTYTLVLSSFFYGYVATQIPTGSLIRAWSPLKIMTLGIFGSSVMNMLTPLLATYGYTAVIVGRTVMGLFQGCLMPCTMTLMSRWVPTQERARLGAFIVNGIQVGTILAMWISGALATSRFGWPSIFYFFGVVGMVSSLLFYCIGADSPSDHPKICSVEVQYINSSLGSLEKISDDKQKVPWKAILTSMPLWAAIVSNCGNLWGSNFLLTQLPTYIKYILGFDTSQSAGISALPYMAMWILGFPISYLSDYFLRRGVSTTVVRKFCASVGLWIPAVCLLVFVLLRTDNKIIHIMIIVVAIGFSSGCSCSTQITHIDLSPNFAAPVSSLAGTLSNLVSLGAPYLCGLVVIDEENASQWHIVFFVTAAVYFFSNSFFLIFGKAEVQPWDSPNYKCEKKAEKKMSKEIP